MNYGMTMLIGMTFTTSLDKVQFIPLFTFFDVCIDLMELTVHISVPYKAFDKSSIRLWFYIAFIVNSNDSFQK